MSKPRGWREALARWELPAERYPWVAAGAAALLYLFSLPGKIFWDSEVLILNNVFLRSLDYLPKIWTTSVMAGGGVQTNYYRPLPVTLLLFEYQLWGPHPFGYHLVSVLLHALNAALVYFWVARFCEDKRAALWTALLFALHPIHSETVNYPDHFEGLLALSFGLTALLALERRGSLFAAAAFACGLLCKEEAAVFAPLMLGRAWLKRRERGRLLDLLPSAAVLAAYVVLRLTVFNFLGGSWTQFGAQKGAYAALPLRLLTFAKALLVYFRLLAAPYHLYFDRALPAAVSWRDPWAWGAVLACAAVLGALWRLSDWRGRAGLVWFGVALLPYCGLVPFNNILAEHFLYIPSVGLFMTLVLLARRQQWSGTAAARAALAALLCVYCATAARRSLVWQRPRRLYASTLRFNPDSYRAANNLGTLFFREGALEEALNFFLRAAAVKPDYAVALNNVGAALEAMDRRDRAAAWYQKAIDADPGYALARRNFGNVLLAEHEYDRAEKELRKAIDAFPEYDSAWKLLGVALYFEGRLPEARAALTRGYELAPDEQTLRRLAQLNGLLSGQTAAKAP